MASEVLQIVQFAAALSGIAKTPTAVAMAGPSMAGTERKLGKIKDLTAQQNSILSGQTTIMKQQLAAAQETNRLLSNQTSAIEEGNNMLVNTLREENSMLRQSLSEMQNELKKIRLQAQIEMLRSQVEEELQHDVEKMKALQVEVSENNFLQLINQEMHIETSFRRESCKVKSRKLSTISVSGEDFELHESMVLRTPDGEWALDNESTYLYVDVIIENGAIETNPVVILSKLIDRSTTVKELKALNMSKLIHNLEQLAKLKKRKIIENHISKFASRYGVRLEIDEVIFELDEPNFIGSDVPTLTLVSYDPFEYNGHSPIEFENCVICGLQPGIERKGKCRKCLGKPRARAGVCRNCKLWSYLNNGHCRDCKPT